VILRSVAAALLFSSTLMLAQAGSADSSASATQAIAAQDQQGIDRDIARHFGDAPAHPGPRANLSGAMQPADVRTAMRKVADWELNWSQPYFDRIWTWSVLYTGFMAASPALHDPKYRDAMQGMAEKSHWELRSEHPNADDQSVGQTYLELYLQNPAPEKIAPTRAALDDLLAGGAAPIPKEQAQIPWWWCDALFMAPPVWSRMYAATHDAKYLDYIDRHWWETSDLLYDSQRHLYFRDVTFLHKTDERGNPVFWSRGNGWVMGGIARTLDYMPQDRPSRIRYETQLREMAAALAPLQDSRNGLWHSDLLDAADYPQPEVSGSALITFALAWGVNHGVLDRATYLPVIARAWRGLVGQIYSDGRLGNIQQTGAAPAHYLPSSSYTYGVGAFLLAGAQVEELAGHGEGATADQTPATSSAANLSGIAHVAIRVADLESSRAFFRKLGFEEAFAMDKGGVPTEAFVKVNDRQFIELYPRRSPGDAVGFMHVCFEAADINAVHENYVDHGLAPTPVRRAGAGNLLFTLQGPKQPGPPSDLRGAATQNIEYTQYMPGSRHTLDRGQHLGPDRIADRIAGVGIPFADPVAATAFYTEQLSFRRASHPLEPGAAALALPGTANQQIELLPASGNSPAGALPFDLFLAVADLRSTAARLRSLGLSPEKHRNALTIDDPDGDAIVFVPAAR